ncbi:MAG: hypothetical protein ACR2RE_24045, partial [Geminicoccaceae bacterium]
LDIDLELLRQDAGKDAKALATSREHCSSASRASWMASWQLAASGTFTRSGFACCYSLPSTRTRLTQSIFSSSTQILAAG